MREVRRQNGQHDSEEKAGSGNHEDKESSPEGEAFRTSYDLCHHGSDCLRQSQMMRQDGHRHHCQCYPYHGYATVRITGVSLTNARLQSWHPVTEMAFTATPWVIVTEVGVAVEANGMVNSCEMT